VTDRHQHLFRHRIPAESSIQEGKTTEISVVFLLKEEYISCNEQANYAN